jgi:hypothetical protein
LFDARKGCRKITRSQVRVFINPACLCNLAKNSFLKSVPALWKTSGIGLAIARKLAVSSGEACAPFNPNREAISRALALIF